MSTMLRKTTPTLILSEVTSLTAQKKRDENDFLS